MERQRRELLNLRKSFVFQSSVVDMDSLEKARSHGSEIKAIFIGTEHPDLNMARILSRVSRLARRFLGPIARIGEEVERALSELPAMKRAVDQLILLDNTAEGRSPRVIAQFVSCETETVRVAQPLARSRPAQNLIDDRTLGQRVCRWKLFAPG